MKHRINIVKKKGIHILHQYADVTDAKETFMRFTKTRTQGMKAAFLLNVQDQN